ncbi:hypothetical protein PAESOLCIP111_06659 [Paenibacillus solanacearum]|uniref:Transposase IS110-like N-terminal domain-containing protein n=1 Tax=Paenibacillus solanacearum TaxID=2048548 RepID=A0A916NM82_9BACL|nr:hypothetical protein PAESOLCIP111_06659 [Paenibacillus solanacearum]
MLSGFVINSVTVCSRPDSPHRNQRELRELVRYRRSLIQERSREHNRVQEVLEGANIKLAAVVSDIMRVSSRDMMEAMIEGEEDPEKLAAFARRTLKKKKEELELGLRGNMSAHQRIMLRTMQTLIDFYKPMRKPQWIREI